MSQTLDGGPGSEGIARGRVHLLRWGIPQVPHKVIPEEEIPEEVERFHQAREWARHRIADLQRGTEERLGRVEGRIFEPQFLMLEDHEVVEGTVRYIREFGLTAARAFEGRMRELGRLLDKINFEGTVNIFEKSKFCCSTFNLVVFDKVVKN